MKVTVALVVFLASLVATANVVVCPPLTAETLIGSWEALEQHDESVILWHMEINKEGESYLCQFTVGTHCIVRRLISSEVKDGNVKLHFGEGTAKELPDHPFLELWIVGPGCGDGRRGRIQWGNETHFIKGTWTRDVAKASELAERAIHERSRH